jgi:CheY-like chemotaxis protein
LDTAIERRSRLSGPVLLVDDDENDLFFMLDAFKKAGVDVPVQIVRDGQEATDYLSGVGNFSDRTRFPMPSLVLLDLKLPFVMGLDVLRAIRQQLNLPIIVIILSASREDADISAAYRLGANAYVVKPSDLTKLTDTVSTH